MPFRFMDNRKKSVRLKRKRDTVGSKLWQIQNAVLTVNEVSPLLNISSTSNKSNQSPSVYLLRGQNTHISRNRVNTVISGLTASSFWLYQTRFFKGFFLWTKGSNLSTLVWTFKSPTHGVFHIWLKQRWTGVRTAIRKFTTVEKILCVNVCPYTFSIYKWLCVSFYTFCSQSHKKG